MVYNTCFDLCVLLLFLLMEKCKFTTYMVVFLSLYLQLVYAESRLDLPRWMLSTELVHAKKIPCTSSNVG